MHILISACLLGINCRYDGGSFPLSPELEELMKKHTLIPVCPEQLGGLTTPRPPAERTGGKVLTIKGTDVTGQFTAGAREALKTARLFGCRQAILKEESPSCGARLIHDGNFRGTLTPGSGLTAQLLRENGVAVLNETQIGEMDDP